MEGLGRLWMEGCMSTDTKYTLCVLYAMVIHMFLLHVIQSSFVFLTPGPLFHYIITLHEYDHPAGRPLPALLWILLQGKVPAPGDPAMLRPPLQLRAQHDRPELLQHHHGDALREDHQEEDEQREVPQVREEVAGKPAAAVGKDSYISAF